MYQAKARAHPRNATLKPIPKAYTLMAIPYHNAYTRLIMLYSIEEFVFEKVLYMALGPSGFSHA